MTTAQIISVSIDSEQAIANVRNVARLSAELYDGLVGATGSQSPGLHAQVIDNLSLSGFCVG